jgi:DNA-directed RNA polymerase subunit RPC12/RpoP
MSWKCPACSSEIFHVRDAAPTLGVVYRCAVCHQELAYDPLVKKMRPLPVPPNTHAEHEKDVA